MNGTSYACVSTEYFQELDAAKSRKDEGWAEAISECTYLKAGVNAIILDESGPFFLIRAIMPNGYGRRYWVNQTSIKAPCHVSSGCN